VPTHSAIRTLLCTGDRRTVGRVPDVVKKVLQHREQLPELMDCLFDEEAAVRMRAADALEKISRVRCDECEPYAGMLLDLLEGTQQGELRWHLAVILPRLPLNSSQRLRTAHALQSCLQARSSLVKVYALQGLVDLTSQEPSLRQQTIDLLRLSERSGTSAMKARSRKLLKILEQQGAQPSLNR
jgi:HEAT repeat protein